MALIREYQSLFNILKNQFNRLAAAETGLMITGFIGFGLAAICAIYVALNGAVIMPEGNVSDAFSFNAALGMFLVSIAIILRLSPLSDQRKTKFRRWMILSALFSYGIETVQHFRGINPRFSTNGLILDRVVGGFFGLLCIGLVILTVWLALSFFREPQKVSFPLVLGIRYAFLSTGLALLSGIVMIILQSRYMGLQGNFIVLHGLGFHALQTLPFIGWLISKRSDKDLARLVHWGGLSWMAAMVLIGVGTALGQSMFALSWAAITSAIALLIWLMITIVSSFLVRKSIGM